MQKITLNGLNVFCDEENLSTLLRVFLPEIERKIADLEVELNGLRERHELLLLDHSASQQRVDQLERHHNMLSDDVDGMKQSVDTIAHNGNELNDRVDSVEADIGDATARLDDHDKAMTNMSDQIDEVESITTTLHRVNKNMHRALCD